MSFIETVKRHIRCPLERVTVIENADDLDPAMIGTGVVFILATWSMPAIMALKFYSDALESCTLTMPFWILNQDALGAAVMADLTAFPNRLGGNGESFFFRDGKQVDCLLRPDREAFIDKYRRAFALD